MKSERVAYVLLLVLGLLGAHRFYVGRNRTGGAILLLTLAGLTVFQPAVLAAVAWLIVDAFLIPGWIRAANGTAGLHIDRSRVWRAARWVAGGVGAGFAVLLVLAALRPDADRSSDGTSIASTAPALTVGQGIVATGADTAGELSTQPDNRLQSNGVACRDRADVVAVQAGTETIDTSVRGGKCRLLFAGARVDIQERDAGLLKIGLNGVSPGQETFWTSEAVLKPAPAAAPVQVKPQPEMAGKYAERSTEPSRDARLSRSVIGCLARDDVSRLTAIAAQGDEAAFEKLNRRLVAQGDCRVLAQGQYVYIAETALFAGLHAVRPTGEPDALWVEREAVERLVP
jgi:TM2 domain-containing membrane protein YozV